MSKPHSLIRVSNKLKSNASCVIVSVALSFQNNVKVEWHNEKLVRDEFCSEKMCMMWREAIQCLVSISGN